MKVFHIDSYKTIVLIDDAIFYGVTLYSLENISVLKMKENIPDNIINEILNAYAGTSTEEEVCSFAIDEDFIVRYAIAQHGRALDILINDEHYMIRKEVANHGYGLDVLINDTYSSVRVAVAQKGYGLDKLINDHRPEVRMVVAEQGYGLKTLARDTDKYVRHVAKQRLAEMNANV
jgi:hypothetical protein